MFSCRCDMSKNKPLNNKSLITYNTPLQAHNLNNNDVYVYGRRMYRTPFYKASGDGNRGAVISRRDKEAVISHRDNSITPFCKASGDRRNISTPLCVPSVDRRNISTPLCVFSVDRGSATVEASIVVPLFFIMFVALSLLADCLRVKNVVYEAFSEAVRCQAEYSYIEDKTNTILDTASLYVRIKGYIDDQELVDKYVSGGEAGILVVQAEKKSDDYIYAKIKYSVSVNIPFFGKQQFSFQEKIRQRAYVGYSIAGYSDQDVTYVYMTENGTVYHNSRNCYHIKFTVETVSESKVSEKYGSLSPCKLCGKKTKGKNVYVATKADCYHTTLACSGLKRTVYRVKKEDHPGLSACSWCGGK